VKPAREGSQLIVPCKNPSKNPRPAARSDLFKKPYSVLIIDA